MTAAQQLLDTVGRLHLTIPALSSLADWLSDITAAVPDAYPVPALPMINAVPGAHPVISALQAAAPQLEWRRTDTEADIGAHFLSTYGYVELYEPTAQLHSMQLGGYIGFWGPGLQYGGHSHSHSHGHGHEAEELYFGLPGFGLPGFGLRGSAQFYAAQPPDIWVAAGQTRHHAPFEAHAMDARAEPFRCYALWKGPGMADLPKMCRRDASPRGLEERPQPSSSEAVGHST